MRSRQIESRSQESGNPSTSERRWVWRHYTAWSVAMPPSANSRRSERMSPRDALMVRLRQMRMFCAAAHAAAALPRRPAVLAATLGILAAALPGGAMAVGRLTGRPLLRLGPRQLV